MLAEASARPNIQAPPSRPARVSVYKGPVPVFPSFVHILQVAKPSRGAGGGGVGGFWAAGSGGSSVLCLFNSLWLKCQFSARLAWLLQNPFC